MAILGHIHHVHVVLSIFLHLVPSQAMHIHYVFSTKNAIMGIFPSAAWNMCENQMLPHCWNGDIIHVPLWWSSEATRIKQWLWILAKFVQALRINYLVPTINWGKCVGVGVSNIIVMIVWVLRVFWKIGHYVKKLAVSNDTRKNCQRYFNLWSTLLKPQDYENFMQWQAEWEMEFTTQLVLKKGANPSTRVTTKALTLSRKGFIKKSWCGTSVLGWYWKSQTSMSMSIYY